MAEIEKGGIPVIPLRGTGQFNPDGVRDYDLLIPASAEDLAVERHAADRERYLADAAVWRKQFIAEFGVRPPETLRPMPAAARSERVAGRGEAAGPAGPAGSSPEPPGRAAESPGP
jgi:hypothetical protein